MKGLLLAKSCKLFFILLVCFSFFNRVTAQSFNYGTGLISSNAAPFSTAGGAGITVSGNDITVTANVNIVTNGANAGIYNFNNLTINSGVTVTVTGGGNALIIRCTGTFTNNGTLKAAGVAGSPTTGGGSTTNDWGSPNPSCSATASLPGGAGGAGGGGWGVSGGTGGVAGGTSLAGFVSGSTPKGTNGTNFASAGASGVAGAGIGGKPSSPITAGSGGSYGTIGGTGAGSSGLNASVGTAYGSGVTLGGPQIDGIKNLWGGCGGGGGGGRLTSCVALTSTGGSGGGGGGGAIRVTANNITLVSGSLISVRGGDGGGNRVGTAIGKGAGGAGSGGTLHLQYAGTISPSNLGTSVNGGGTTSSTGINIIPTFVGGSYIDIAGGSGGNCASGFTIGGDGGQGRYLLEVDVASCSAPTLTAKANGTAATLSTCATSITLTANNSGGTGCANFYEYAWSNGTSYWGGSSFNSATATYSSTYTTIAATQASGTITYTVNARCNALTSCASTPSAVVVTVGSAFDYGTGAEGAYTAPGGSSTLSGTHNYTTFTIPSGSTVTAAGNAPLIIKCTGAASISGTLTAAGGNGTIGGIFTMPSTPAPPGTGGTGGGGGWGAGGGNGGTGVVCCTSGTGLNGNSFGTSTGRGVGGTFYNGVATEQAGTGGSYGTQGTAGLAGTGGAGNVSLGSIYGDAALLTSMTSNSITTTLLGGSGGGGGGARDQSVASTAIAGGDGGGGGGGAIRITAYSVSIASTGLVSVRGGNGPTTNTNGVGAGAGGSGGTLNIQTATSSLFTYNGSTTINGATGTDVATGINFVGGTAGNAGSGYTIGGTGGKGIYLTQADIAPTINFTNVISSVCQSAASQTGSFAYSATSGGPTQYSITWSNTATTAGFSNVSNITLPLSTITVTVPAGVSAGTYTGTLTVSNTTCTSFGYTITVKVNAATTAGASNTGAYCSYGTITLSSSPNLMTSYSWSGVNAFSSTLQSPTRSASGNGGTYTVTVTDGNGCTSSASTTVTVNLPSNASASNGGPYCSYQTISLSAALGMNSYSWTGPNAFSSPSQNPTVAANGNGGTYNVTVTDANNCTSSGSTNVTVNVPASPSPGNTGPYCSYQSISLSSTSGMSSYTWSGPNSFNSSSQNPTSFSASGNGGTYTVTTTDGNSCSSSASTVVTVNVPPVASANDGGPYCSYETISLLSGPNSMTSYTWSNGATTQNTTLPAIGNGGTYTITVTDSHTCTSSASTTVTVNVPATTIVIPTTANPCSTDITPLSASGSVNYSWSPSADLDVSTGGSVNASPSTNATFTVTGTDANNCTSSTTSVFTVRPVPVISVTPSSAVCTGTVNSTLIASATSGGGSPYTYSWSPASFLNTTTGTTVTAQISQLTFYTVTGTGANGCTANSETVPVATVPVGGNSLPAFVVICNGGTKTLTTSGAAGNSYQWQISTNNINWTDIAGATKNNYTTQVSDGASKKYYRLLAESNACYNVASTTSVVDISATPVVTVTNVTETTATVTWSPYGTSQYNINWSGAAGSGSSNAVTTNNFTISGLTANQDLLITVTQATPTCSGVNPSSASTHTLCGKPTLTNLVATAVHGFTASWSAVSGVTSYRLFYRDLSTSGSWSFTDITGITATVNVLYSNHTFAVYVAAKNCPSAGNIGDGSNISYVTTNPVSACSPVPTVTTSSSCPNQIHVDISGSTPPYNVILRRISPSLTSGASYPISSSSFDITIGTQYAGSTWEIFATKNCGANVVSSISNISIVTVKPGCPVLNNVVVSHPTCNGFTVSWNGDDCAGLGIAGYQLLIKKNGTANYTGYPVGTATHDLVSWLPPANTWNVVVMSVACNGATSAFSLPDTISTLSCGRTGDDNEPSLINSGNGNELVAVYPNPTDGQFWVDVATAQNNSSMVKVEVINQLGEVVQTQLGEITGGHLSQMMIIPEGIATGIYFVKTTVLGNEYVNRMMIIKE